MPELDTLLLAQFTGASRCGCLLHSLQSIDDVLHVMVPATTNKGCYLQTYLGTADSYVKTLSVLEAL